MLRISSSIFSPLRVFAVVTLVIPATHFPANAQAELEPAAKKIGRDAEKSAAEKEAKTLSEREVANMRANAAERLRSMSREEYHIRYNLAKDPQARLGPAPSDAQIQDALTDSLLVTPLLRPQLPSSASIAAGKTADGAYWLMGAGWIDRVDTGSYPALADAIVQMLKDKAQNGGYLGIHLQDFPESEAQALLKTVQLRCGFEEQCSRAFGLSYKQTPGVRAMLTNIDAGAYDLSKAELTSFANDSGTVQFSIAIPAFQANGNNKSLVLRVRLVMKQALFITRSSIDSIVGNVFAGSSAPVRSAYDAGKLLKSELQRLHPDITRIDLVYSTELGDIYFSNSASPRVSFGLYGTRDPEAYRAE